MSIHRTTTCKRPGCPNPVLRFRLCETHTKEALANFEAQRGKVAALGTKWLRPRLRDLPNTPVACCRCRSNRSK